MIYTLFPAQERGSADYGWLKTHYSFSFANWYNPARIHFGNLRVLNDDQIAPHSGFDLHPHNDMEIITIVLEGELTHKDSMGNKGVIKKNEVQVMSAGTGIYHSEKNESEEWTRLFQIWIFPNKKGHTPRYDQKLFSAITNNQWQLLVSPDGRNNSLFIHQNAFISKAKITDKKINYTLYDDNNKVYLMVINGELSIEQNTLKHRDAIGISDVSEILIINHQPITEALIIEVSKN